MLIPSEVSAILLKYKLQFLSRESDGENGIDKNDQWDFKQNNKFT